MTPLPGDLVRWWEQAWNVRPDALDTAAVERIGIVIRVIGLDEYFASRGIEINPHECDPDELATIRSGLKQVEVLHNEKIVTHFISNLEVVV